MSPETKGVLEYWEAIQREKGNSPAAEMARILREQYGDESFPQEGGGKNSTINLPPALTHT